MAAAGHPIDGVLHVGVREDAPLPDYRSCGASPCIYVDKSRETCRRLTELFADDPWHIAVCADRVGDSASSESALEAFFEKHFGVVRQPVVTSTVDELAAKYSARRLPNLLVIDAPGSELGVLRGAVTTLTAVDGVFLSVSEEPLHPGASTFTEIQIHLISYGLLPRWLEIDRHGRGRAFFSRPAAVATVLPTFEGNLALNKSAAQSSLSEWSRPTIAEEAGRGVNGQITGDCSFHTDNENNPWWLVDLGKVKPLKEIRIFNRPGPYRVRARTLKVFITEDAEGWTEVHDQAGYSFGGTSGVPLRIFLEQHRARFIALRLAERTCLHLDEIEVY